MDEFRQEYTHLGEPTSPVRARAFGQYRVCLHPAGGSGDRTFCRSVFRPQSALFRSRNIIKLAIEGGCNAVASTFGVLGAVARKYAHKIPFIVKLNHNELLTYPNSYDQVMFGTVKRHGTWVL